MENDDTLYFDEHDVRRCRACDMPIFDPPGLLLARLDAATQYERSAVLTETGVARKRARRRLYGLKWARVYLFGNLTVDAVAEMDFSSLPDYEARGRGDCCRSQEEQQEERQELGDLIRLWFGKQKEEDHE